MENAVIIGLLFVIIGAAAAYIVKAKRSGVKCIGCSAGGACAQKKGGSCCGCSNAQGCGCGGSRDGRQGGCHTETK